MPSVFGGSKYDWLLEAGVAVCGLSLAAGSRGGNLWSISAC